jgi:hypothetical protein
VEQDGCPKTSSVSESARPPRFNLLNSRIDGFGDGISGLKRDGIPKTPEAIFDQFAGFDLR